MPIEWTEDTWNPLGGCSKVSPGCKFCYAIGEAIRMHTRVEKYEGTVVSRPKPNWTGRINFNPAALRLPYKWKTPKRIFVNSMSDLFHKDVPFDWVRQIFAVMNDCPQHQFQVLTKRSDILRAVAPMLTWTPNISAGVSVENADYVYRIDDLRAMPAAIKWLSIEPLLGPLNNLDLRGIDWVVTGGLSGGDAPARPQDTQLADWVRSIRDQCQPAGVAFFFKQWGGPKAVKKANGRMLDNKEWMEYPVTGGHVGRTMAVATPVPAQEPTDAVPPASNVASSHQRTARRPTIVRASDVVYTRPEMARRIVDHFQPTGRLLDPAKGQGAFYNALLKVPGAQVDWCEIAEGRDFLYYTRKVDWIITNPPWSNGPFRHFLTHAFDLADNIVFLIKTQMARSTVARIRSERLAGFGQKEWVMMGWHDAFDIPGYNSGLAVAAVHWQKGYVGPITQTDWTESSKIAA